MKAIVCVISEEHLSHHRSGTCQWFSLYLQELVLMADLVVAELMVLPSASHSINRVSIVSF